MRVVLVLAVCALPLLPLLLTLPRRSRGSNSL